MTISTLRIATRQSPLALWQAHYVQQQLQYYHPNLTIELIPIVTRGDILLDTPLAKVGGKGLFVKELELALLASRADIAVHSMKDVPISLPDGLVLNTICQRAQVEDAFVANHYQSLDQLPSGSLIGTSSLRRQCQLRHYRPDLRIADLRGNVGTRLKKLDSDQFAAIILASAGLHRLDLADRIKQILPISLCLPAVGQGAIGIECRADDELTQQLLAPLHHTASALCVQAERAMNIHLNGGCQVPIAGFAQLDDQQIYLQALVGSHDGQTIIRSQASGSASQAESLGIQVAQHLLAQGAEPLLQAASIHE